LGNVGPHRTRSAACRTGWRQEVQSLALHSLAAAAQNAPDFEFEIYTHLAIGQVACSMSTTVVPTEMDRSAGAAECFFPRRVRRTSRARESPNIPCTVRRGRKPGKLYVSASRRAARLLGIRESCQNFRPPGRTKPWKTKLRSSIMPSYLPTRFREDPV